MPPAKTDLPRAQDLQLPAMVALSHPCSRLPMEAAIATRTAPKHVGLAPSNQGTRPPVRAHCPPLQPRERDPTRSLELNENSETSAAGDGYHNSFLNAKPRHTFLIQEQPIGRKIIWRFDLRLGAVRHAGDGQGDRRGGDWDR